MEDLRRPEVAMEEAMEAEAEAEAAEAMARVAALRLRLLLMQTLSELTFLIACLAYRGAVRCCLVAEGFRRLWSWFNAVDTDRSGHISAPELERALINGDWTPFDLDTVKLLMSIFVRAISHSSTFRVARHSSLSCARSMTANRSDNCDVPEPQAITSLMCNLGY